MYVFSILTRIFDTQQSNVAELHSVLQRVSHELLHAVVIGSINKHFRSM